VKLDDQKKVMELSSGEIEADIKLSLYISDEVFFIKKKVNNSKSSSAVQNKARITGQRSHNAGNFPQGKVCAINTQTKKEYCIGVAGVSLEDPDPKVDLLKAQQFSLDVDTGTYNLYYQKEFEGGLVQKTFYSLYSKCERENPKNLTHKPTTPYLQKLHKFKRGKIN
jgi:hypothetical protein